MDSTPYQYSHLPLLVVPAYDRPCPNANPRAMQTPVPNLPLMMMPDKKKRMSTRLVIPFLVEIINESVFVVVATRTTAALVAEGNAAVTSAGGEEASTGGSEDYEHVLITMLAIDCG